MVLLIPLSNRLGLHESPSAQARAIVRLRIPRLLPLQRKQPGRRIRVAPVERKEALRGDVGWDPGNADARSSSSAALAASD